MPLKDRQKQLAYFREYNRKRYPLIKWRYHNDPKEKARRIRNIRNYELRHIQKIREIKKLLQRKYRARKKGLTIIPPAAVEEMNDDLSWDDEDNLDDFSF